MISATQSIKNASLHQRQKHLKSTRLYWYWSGALHNGKSCIRGKGWRGWGQGRVGRLPGWGRAFTDRCCACFGKGGRVSIGVVHLGAEGGWLVVVVVWWWCGGGDQPNYTWLIQSNRSGPMWIEGLELILLWQIKINVSPKLHAI